VGYCELGDVKLILQIPAGDSTFDAELQSCITSADALIDSLLKYEGLSVPSPVPQLVADASAHYAAWLFRKRRDPTGAEAFWAEADKFLTAYIESEGEATGVTSA